MQNKSDHVFLPVRKVSGCRKWTELKKRQFKVHTIKQNLFTAEKYSKRRYNSNDILHTEKIEEKFVFQNLKHYKSWK